MKDRVVHPVDGFDSFRFPEPGEDRGDDLEVVGEVLQDRQSFGFAAGGVQVDERRAGSASEHLDLAERSADPLVVHDGRHQAAATVGNVASVRKHYLEALNLVERLHRQLLDVIKDELDRRDEREINSVQALLLFNVGDQELTAGELRTRGHYLGSNVSYNLKKLVEGGYIHHERSEADRRSVLVRLTRKGEAVRDMLREMFNRHLGSLEAVGNVDAGQLDGLNTTLKRLERFWIDQVRFRL